MTLQVASYPPFLWTSFNILRYERYGFIVMMVVLFSGILNTPLVACRTWILHSMSSSVEFLYYAVYNLLN